VSSGTPQEGNVVGVRQAYALDLASAQHRASMHEDTSFTRSRDPCTSIGTRVLLVGRQKRLQAERVAVDQVSRSGKPAQVGGTGTEGWSNGRCAARRVSPLSQERSRVMRQKRKVVEAIVPARKRELG
jgi:hypothetical protein